MPNAGIVEKLSRVAYVVLGQPIAQVTVAEPHSGEAAPGHSLDWSNKSCGLTSLPPAAANWQSPAMVMNVAMRSWAIACASSALGLRAALMKESMRRGPLR